MRRVSFTLGQQIAGVFAIVSIGLVAASLMITTYVGRREAVRAVNEEIATVAGHLASALDRGMFERFREIHQLTHLEQLRGTGEKDRAAARAVFTRRQTTLPELAWIGFTAVDGTVLVASRAMLEGSSVAERPWFKQGLKGAWAGDLHEAKLLEPLLGPSPDGEPFRFVDVTAPVLDNGGRVLGVLGAHLSWKWAGDVRADLLQSSGTGVEAMILSADGKILLGPEIGSEPFSAERLAAMKADKKGTFETQTEAGPVLNGFSVTNGFRDYPGLGWIVVARRPAAVAFARVDAATNWIAVAGLGLALLGVALAWWLSRRVTRPIRELTVAAGQIGRDPHATMPRVTGPREVEELSASLRALVRHVDAAERQAQHVSEHSLVAARRFEQEISVLRVAADTDPLTGLLNRRAFLSAADDAMKYWTRYGRNFGILVADIDFFKRVNDTYGHPAGDAVIRHVGNSLSELVRTTDKVGRFGGEEFVVLLREIGPDGIEALAQRMRQIVRQRVLTFSGHNIAVSISIGGTLVSDQDRDVHEVIERADHALYDAKAAGRNAVVIAERSDVRRAA